jgi:hypothetical protein
MEQSDVLELKRGFVRKGQLWWGVPMAVASPLIIFGCMSGPIEAATILAWLFISAMTSLTAFYLGALWAEVMWLIFKDNVLRAAEMRAEREKA